MSEWLTKVINASEARGSTRGEEKGIRAMAGLVKDHIISAAEAAKRMDMTEKDFCEKAGLPIVQ